MEHLTFTYSLLLRQYYLNVIHFKQIIVLVNDLLRIHSHKIYYIEFAILCLVMNFKMS